MLLKDFFWLILKDNRIINWIYLQLFSALFKAPQDIKIHFSGLTTKNLLLQTPRPKPIFAIQGYTSGTTNQPLTVYRSVKSILLEEYMFKTFLARHQVPLNAKIAVMRGDMIKSSAEMTAPFWKKMPFTGRVFFSSFHLSSQSAPLYLQQLEKEQPDIILAYPSAITFLARQAQLSGWQPNWPFFGVFTSSETFSAEQQQICRAVFGKVFDHYGQAERVAALQQCEFGHYHVRDDYSLVEFVEDSAGIKIVGTNYHNSAMPLLRYDTGDYVEGLNCQGNCRCGDPSRFVLRILGRDDDYVVLPDGRHIGRLDVAFKGIEGLAECQLVQTDPLKLEVHFVPLPVVDILKLQHQLSQALQQRLGPQLELNFIQQTQIARTKAGKFKSVVRLIT